MRAKGHGRGDISIYSFTGEHFILLGEAFPRVREGRGRDRGSFFFLLSPG